MKYCAMINDPLIIKLMCEEDLKDVMKIELRSFPSPWSPLAFVTELRHNEDAYYFCLYSYGILLGYLGVWLIFDEGYITRLAIHPDFRAKGHGSYLIRQVLEWMKPRGVKRLNLEIRSSNTLACSFYKKLGFLPRATKQEYYTDPPEDAMVMTLDLNCP
ncbi:Ribosomal-protein-alanine acetyltransferase [Desulfitobacterium hafniense]|uniref:Ribosomal-protein-alanine acetyltransferase n=1 Tax=Desulfitobacterium hafniense TaxID=49338 RepID=A0A098B0K5_DESHA|nr:ribosomal protein S18-alanine N-acetyltransferase [Desulfitobacterium hafniense]CDX01406.1 Ribosomal-protein-alanine acetyltransferase [Desulfitobacterium hafniense]